MAGPKVIAAIDLCSGLVQVFEGISSLRGFKQDSRSTGCAPEERKQKLESSGGATKKTCGDPRETQTEAQEDQPMQNKAPEDPSVQNQTQDDHPEQTKAAGGPASQAISRRRLDAGTAGAATCPLFAAPDADFLKHLEEQGFAVLTGVMTAETLGAYDQAFWAAMQGILPAESPFNKPGEPGSWRFPGGFRGATWCYGLPQSDFAWILRENSNIRSAFEAIHCEKDLVVSLDAIIAQAALPKTKQGLWLHKDQRPSKKLLSVQAAYTRYGGGGDKGGTCFSTASNVFFRILRFFHIFVLFLPELRTGKASFLALIDRPTSGKRRATIFGRHLAGGSRRRSSCPCFRPTAPSSSIPAWCMRTCLRGKSRKSAVRFAWAATCPGALPVGARRRPWSSRRTPTDRDCAPRTGRTNAS